MRVGTRGVVLYTRFYGTSVFFKGSEVKNCKCEKSCKNDWIVYVLLFSWNPTGQVWFCRCYFSEKCWSFNARVHWGTMRDTFRGYLQTFFNKKNSPARPLLSLDSRPYVLSISEFLNNAWNRNNHAIKNHRRTFLWLKLCANLFLPKWPNLERTWNGICQFFHVMRHVPQRGTRELLQLLLRLFICCVSHHCSCRRISNSEVIRSAQSEKKNPHKTQTSLKNVCFNAFLWKWTAQGAVSAYFLYFPLRNACDSGNNSLTALLRAGPHWLVSQDSAALGPAILSKNSSLDTHPPELAVRYSEQQSRK